MTLLKNTNEADLQQRLARVLHEIPAGQRLLDAGAGEPKNRQRCAHLDYVSQDFSQYQGAERGLDEGRQSGRWDTSRNSLVSDITAMPAPDASFVAILCSEMFEYVPEPTHALDECTSLLKPGGRLILAAPSASNVHMAPQSLL